MNKDSFGLKKKALAFKLKLNQSVLKNAPPCYSYMSAAVSKFK